VQFVVYSKVFMRLLFISNFYPPFSRGGYEQWCQEVAEGLQNRAHEVLVLTSDYENNAPHRPEPEWIHRKLHLEMDLASLRNGLIFFTGRRSRESDNLSLLQQHIESFRPDIVFIWGMWNLPRSLPASAEDLMPGRVAYYMGDYWPALPDQFEYYWNAPARSWATGIPKSILKPVAVQILAGEMRASSRFEHVIFPSAYMRDEFIRRGISPQQTKIIYGAIDTSLYQYRAGHSDSQKNGETSLLYAGRLISDKGVHTAVEAMGYLVNQVGINQVHLTIVGTGEAEYEAHLHELARQYHVEDKVKFLGAQTKESMPRLYQHADIFLFTSFWPEPFGRVIVEAMASGVAVVGTATGGAAEILVDNENALLYPPGDAIGLAKQITRLIESPSLHLNIASAGRLTARTRFDLQRMVTEIEAYLDEMLN
jgi:glycosyltransferase involved in cell wall biosynthesis